MADKGLDFKHKEVINITNGKRLGYVQDVCADLETGMISSIFQLVLSHLLCILYFAKVCLYHHFERIY